MRRDWVLPKFALNEVHKEAVVILWVKLIDLNGFGDARGSCRLVGRRDGIWSIVRDCLFVSCEVLAHRHPFHLPPHIVPLVDYPRSRVCRQEEQEFECIGFLAKSGEGCFTVIHEYVSWSFTITLLRAPILDFTKRELDWSEAYLKKPSPLTSFNSHSSYLVQSCTISPHNFRSFQISSTLILHLRVRLYINFNISHPSHIDHERDFDHLAHPRDSAADVSSSFIRTTDPQPSSSSTSSTHSATRSESSIRLLMLYLFQYRSQGESKFPKFGFNDSGIPERSCFSPTSNEHKEWLITTM